MPTALWPWGLEWLHRVQRDMEAQLQQQRQEQAATAERLLQDIRKILLKIPAPDVYGRLQHDVSKPLEERRVRVTLHTFQENGSYGVCQNPAGKIKSMVPPAVRAAVEHRCRAERLSACFPNDGRAELIMSAPYLHSVLP